MNPLKQNFIQILNACSLLSCNNFVANIGFFNATKQVKNSPKSFNSNIWKLKQQQPKAQNYPQILQVIKINILVLQSKMHTVQSTFCSKHFLESRKKYQGHKRLAENWVLVRKNVVKQVGAQIEFQILRPLTWSCLL